MKVLQFCFIVIVFLNGCSALPQSGTIRTEKYNYYSSGNKTPPIVFQSGLGDGMETWSKVIPKLTSQKVFAYDRLGYGRSSSQITKSDPCSIAKDLRSLLKEANIPPPYILVGHSLGGLYQFVFAMMYPEDVSELVLLDPTHPNHWQQMRQKAPLAASAIKVINSTVFNQAAQEEFKHQTVCLENILTNKTLNTPTTFVFSSEFTPLEKGNFQDMVESLRNDWVNFLPNSEIIYAVGSGHYIQSERPDMVIGVLKRN